MYPFPVTLNVHQCLWDIHIKMGLSKIFSVPRALSDMSDKACRTGILLQMLPFCRSIFRVSSGCPIPSYYWQSGSRKFENIILQNKLNFLFHLANLPITSLAGSIYQEQKKNPELKGLVSELQEHVRRIHSGSLTAISKWQWKQRVKKYVKNEN